MEKLTAEEKGVARLFTVEILFCHIHVNIIICTPYATGNLDASSCKFPDSKGKRYFNICRENILFLF